MSNLPPPPPPPPPPGRTPGRGPAGPGGGKEDGRGKGPLRGAAGLPRWSLWVLFGVLALLLFGSRLIPQESADKIGFGEFQAALEQGQVKEFKLNNATLKLTGELTTGKKFSTTAPNGYPNEQDRILLTQKNVTWEAKSPESNWLTSILPLLLPILLFIGFIVWMNRRAQGQMGNVMSIGRSRAKAYTTDRPSTTFADVAGYDSVKLEIKEVVDFLRAPERFKEIGARIPKGILLVGPPGTGKTLFARAVAGEAGVGFLSVTGSDFMEMFVGVGASRVRDLFQQAR
jgi:cell division protease FtsH